MTRQRNLELARSMASGIFLLLIIVQPTGIRASPLVSHSLGDHAAPRLIRIHEVVSVKAEADTAYILMTVQTERGQLVEAVRENEKQMQAFIAALTQTGIPLAAISIKNFVVEPAIVGRGFSLARNLVITEAQINRRPAGELAQRMARIQDLGARFGSSCITCIGSG